MLSLIILFIGTFWEVSMDVIGAKHNYDYSRWKLLADYFDSKNVRILGNRFWDNSISWKNKWKNHNPIEGEAYIGSSTVFAPITDGWHLTKFMWLMHLFGAVITFEQLSDYFIIDMVIFYIVFGIGHELFRYILLLKQKPKQNESQ